MARYSSYILCGTPRSGSTLLCQMLTASGIAGHPHSYYRQQDIGYWADRWGVAHPDGMEDEAFDRRYLSAMLGETRSKTGVFGLRLMWGSIAEAQRRLDRALGGEADVAARFQEAFGPTLYLHLSRLDKVAQAVSLVRAEQSGLWHVAANGSVLEGADVLRPTTYDGARVGALVRELQSDDAAWNNFFHAYGIEPLRFTYETVAADPRGALASIFSALGFDPDLASSITMETAKMGDGKSREWTERFRSEKEHSE